MVQCASAIRQPTSFSAMNSTRAASMVATTYARLPITLAGRRSLLGPVGMGFPLMLFCLLCVVMIMRFSCD
jgi:hypothetical protein